MLATVSASALNVRSFPGITGRVVGTLMEGTVVDAEKATGDWLEIPYKDSTGFVSKHHMDINPNTKQMHGFVLPTVLNVRERPDSYGTVLGTLMVGTRVEVLSRYPEWLEIEFNNGSGFVLNKFIELFSSGESYTARVVASALNVRANPKTNAQVLGQLTEGTRLEVIAKQGSWSEINFNGQRAYVASNYLGKLDENDEDQRITVAEDDDNEDGAIAHTEEPEAGVALQPIRLLEISGSQRQQKVAKTWNRYGGLLENLSRKKNIDVASAIAVLCVESSGKGFEQNNDNKMIIRFENHKFWRYWGKKNPGLYRKHFQYLSGKAWTKHKWRKADNLDWQGFHGNQAKEWQVFDFARGIDADSAMLSISMGAPQIMGFHYERIGYQSIEEMFNSFATDISAHIYGLFDFFSEAMLEHLRSLDFESFAAGYNGSGQKEKYGKWINAHYQAFKKIQLS